MKVNINLFYDKFNEMYSFLEDHDVEIDNYREAVAAFDAFLHENPVFVSKFAEYRGDFISSDREAAAFMFAYAELVEEELEDEDDY